ncbi:MAG: glycosyltransferase [Bradymonadales bacterium]|nr:glycosyltransferase [Bradymonadales bacterium]
MILILTSSYPAFPDDYRGAFVQRMASAISNHGIGVHVIAPFPADLPVGIAARDIRTRDETDAAASDRLVPPRLTTPAPDLSDVPQREGWVRHFADVERISAPNPAEGSRRTIYFGRRGDRLPYGTLYGGDGMVNNLACRPLNLHHLLPSLAHMRRVLLEQAGDAELVMAHWLLPAGLVAAWSRSAYRRPVWVVCHSGGVHAFGWLPGPFRRWAAGVFERGCDLISFTTPALRDRFLHLAGPTQASKLRDRCRILPMGVETAAFAGVGPDPGGPVSVVARLDRLKGIDRLLLAAASLRQPCRLRIAGGGPWRPRLQRLAARLGIDASFLGEIPVGRVPQVLDGSSLAVLPSRRLADGRSEGLPVFALEALASGLPLLTTDSWDMPDTLRSLPGVFRIASGQRQLARGLREALQYARAPHPEEESTRRRAASDFDWSRIGEQAARWIRSLVERSR